MLKWQCQGCGARYEDTYQPIVFAGDNYCRACWDTAERALGVLTNLDEHKDKKGKQRKAYQELHNITRDSWALETWGMTYQEYLLGPRIAIIKRDNHECRLSESGECEGTLQVCRIDTTKPHSVENCITLCEKHHDIYDGRHRKFVDYTKGDTSDTPCLSQSSSGYARCNRT